MIRDILLAIIAVEILALCLQAWRAAKELTAERQEATSSHTAMLTALVRIEDAAEAAREAAVRTAARIDVATELGFQNRESQGRTEAHDAHVASDLAESIRRADAMPNDGNFGAAADAALRSPHSEVE